MPQLTPTEKQEIIRHVEAGKPLPEKYRWLLFDDKREVELVWNGKTNEVCNVVLPFQTIEHVDEPRNEEGTARAAGKPLQQQLFSVDGRGRQLKGWTNKLIWGDNKLILSSLKNGPLREEIERNGGIKLIYIDPPFDVGADFSMDIEIGDDTFTKKPNILEEIAYRDTWGRGADSFISMIYERLILMRDLMAEDGSIYVHMGPKINHLVRAVLDEVFGEVNSQRELIWKRVSARGHGKAYPATHDSILFYSKGENFVWNQQFLALDKDYVDSKYRFADPDGRKYRKDNCLNQNTNRPNLSYEWNGHVRTWRWTKDNMKILHDSGRLIYTKTGVPEYKRYLDESEGVALQSVWTDVDPVNSQANEDTQYATQKPTTLLERIIKSSSNPGDIVADFFCGSGTTAAVAEKLGRKWIVSDLGKFAIHTTRKRLIGVQRQRKAEDQDYRAFEILNLGKYERQHFIGINPNLREEQQQQQLAAKEADFLALILRAYKAEPTTGLKTFHGKKGGRMVVVGPVNLPVSRLFVEEVISECRQKHLTKVDLLGFEFEMGLFPNVLDEAKSKGIDIQPKYIPAEVFDKRAIEKNQVVFHDVAAIEVKPIVKGKTVAVQLTDFSVYYSQDRADEAAEKLKEKGSKIVVERGQIVKISKSAKGVVTREQLTKHWTDWIDYWSVDFDFENKREIIRVPKEINPSHQSELPGMKPAQKRLEEWEEVWTGDYIFENEWQSFRTKKDRSLELTSTATEFAKDKKRVKIAVKVVDIFGNDTMTIVDVNVGGKK